MIKLSALYWSGFLGGRHVSVPSRIARVEFGAIVNFHPFSLAYQKMKSWSTREAEPQVSYERFETQ